MRGLPRLLTALVAVVLATGCTHGKATASGAQRTPSASARGGNPRYVLGDANSVRVFPAPAAAISLAGPVAKIVALGRDQYLVAERGTQGLNAQLLDTRGHLVSVPGVYADIESGERADAWALEAGKFARLVHFTGGQRRRLSRLPTGTTLLGGLGDQAVVTDIHGQSELLDASGSGIAYKLTRNASWIASLGLQLLVAPASCAAGCSHLQLIDPVSRVTTAVDLPARIDSTPAVASSSATAAIVVAVVSGVPRVLLVRSGTHVIDLGPGTAPVSVSGNRTLYRGPDGGPTTCVDATCTRRPFEGFSAAALAD